MICSGGGSSHAGAAAPHGNAAEPDNPDPLPGRCGAPAMVPYPTTHPARARTPEGRPMR